MVEEDDNRDVTMTRVDVGEPGGNASELSNEN